ncbi:MAG: hypothetical protein LBO72_09640 [Helicobacteraceae bacterium]|jgi:hypothetical protein|nr:hypothetical protein [Helicobacteraceae bacterium]
MAKMYLKTTEGFVEIGGSSSGSGSSAPTFNSPDYSNAESDNKITIPTADTGDRTYSWTVEKDGFIQFELGNEGGTHYGGGIFGRINSARVLAVAEGWVWNDGVFGVKKGDIVSVNIPTKQANDTAKVRCYFIPPLFSVTEQTPLATDYYDYSAGDGVNHITTNGGEWIADNDGIVVCSMGRHAVGSAGFLNTIYAIDNKSVYTDNILAVPADGWAESTTTLEISKGQTIRMNAFGLPDSELEIYCRFYPRKYKSIQPQEFQYSTDEKWVGKYWIDGKKIYAKVFEQDYTPTMSWEMYTIPIADLGIDRVVSAEGYADRLSDHHASGVIPYTNNMTGNLIEFRWGHISKESGIMFHAISNSDSEVFRVTITLYYTKA